MEIWPGSLGLVLITVTAQQINPGDYFAFKAKFFSKKKKDILPIVLKVVQTEYMHLTSRFHHPACALHPIPSFANDNTHVQLPILNMHTGQKHIEKRKHGHSAVDSYTHSDTPNTTSRMSLKMSVVF